ncbi:MAG: HlyC/CorC family transporter [Sandaracinaceae bacterium]|jgi:CBS domain containing-hemolysin-like protein|nr:HlyC/CorC family transporter [Sandaracinaceae bacterium]MBK7153454.1 HlyC/CorC family transporter [Sandaracinaceae bacterium]MBK7772641.1 HlyC/CorC family transporter [Sandaracinaceae bacterium]MBK8406845.1 HlyC/CorC family transporter [Sandaracinaceae bacterium]MBP7682774.1 HlyC/CorC family transporter [Deltaproteobacteria bacterium]
MNDVLGLVLTVGLLVLNAFFVAAEFALISVRRTKIEPRAEGGSLPAKVTLYAMEHVSLMMAGAQLGITIASLALGSLSEPAIAHLMEVPMELAGVPAAFLHPISFTLALTLVTFLHVIIGEMVPKNLALAEPERAALLMAPLLVVIVWMLYPVLWLLNGVSNVMLRLVGIEPKHEVTSAFTRDEVADLVEESLDGGLIELNDERLLLGALNFTERDVRSVLVPMAHVRTLPLGVTPAQAEAAAADSFSRFPLRAQGDQLVGYVHIKDLLENDPQARRKPMDPRHVRPLPSVRVTDSLREVMVQMQRTNAHLAVVLEADAEAPAEPLGIVTLEDVLEELVGKIRDDSRRATGRRGNSEQAS